MTPRTWLTADEVVKAGTPAGDVICTLCHAAPWDGQEGRSSPPTCRSCRKQMSVELGAGIAIFLRDLEDERVSA